MPTTRNEVFDRVEVDHLVTGSTRVAWSIAPHFFLLEDNSYQLQISEVGTETSDDWEDIGATASNTFLLVNDEQRNYGATQNLYYRVKLTQGSQTYYSKPAHTYGIMRKHDWLIARAIMRRELLRFDRKTASHGFLFRRRWRGETPPDTEVDMLTGGIRRTRGGEGYGTAFVNGFYDPVRCYIELNPDQDNIATDLQGTGTVNPQGIQGARAMAFPAIYTNDLWVHPSSDIRYLVHQVSRGAVYRGVPIVQLVEMRPISRNHDLYRLEVSEP